MRRSTLVGLMAAMILANASPAFAQKTASTAVGDYITGMDSNNFYDKWAVIGCHRTANALTVGAWLGPHTLVTVRMQVGDEILIRPVMPKQGSLTLKGIEDCVGTFIVHKPE